MSHRLTAGNPLVLLLSLWSLGGCEAIEEIAGGLDRPTARIVDARLENLRLDGADLLFDIDVSNPSPVPVPVVGLDYTIRHEGESFLTGRSEPGVSIPSKGSMEVSVHASVRFAELLGVLAAVRPGEVVPYEAELDLGIDAAEAGRLTLPLRSSGELPVPAPPVVAFDGMEIRKLSLARAEALLRLTVQNPNRFPIDLRGLSYGLSLAGSKIARTDLDHAASIGPRRSTTLEIPLAFTPSSLGAAALGILGGAEAPYALDGTFDAETPFGPLALPFDSSGIVPLLR